MACLPYLLFGYCVCDSVLEVVSVGYGSNNNRLMIRERAEWMVDHFDRIS